MRGIGKMIYRMGMGLKVGLMGLNMKEIIKVERNMEKEHILGLMGLSMWVLGLKIEFLGRELIHGLMEENMK